MLGLAFPQFLSGEALVLNYKTENWKAFAFPPSLPPHNDGDGFVPRSLYMLDECPNAEACLHPQSITFVFLRKIIPAPTPDKVSSSPA